MSGAPKWVEMREKREMSVLAAKQESKSRDVTNEPICPESEQC